MNGNKYIGKFTMKYVAKICSLFLEKLEKKRKKVLLQKVAIAQKHDPIEEDAVNDGFE